MDGLNNNTGPNLILVKTALDKLRSDDTQKVNTRGKATAMDPVVFTQSSATNAAVVTSVIGGGGYFNKSTDDVNRPKEAAKKAASPRTTLIAEFDQNLPISRTFMADQQQSAVSRSVRQSFQAWESTRDRNAFLVYANGFTTQTTIDGVALFSNSHVNENNNTVDNLETGAMSDTNVNVAVNSLRGQVNQTGVLIGYEPSFLLTSGLQHIDGTRITKSVLRAGSGNNDMNYWSDLYPGMEVVYNQHLDSVSTTAYFVGAAGHDLMRFEREAFFTDLVDWRTQADDQYIYKMRAREEVDSISYVGLVGSTGVA